MGYWCLTLTNGNLTMINYDDMILNLLSMKHKIHLPHGVGRSWYIIICHSILICDIEFWDLATCEGNYKLKK